MMSCPFSQLGEWPAHVKVFKKGISEDIFKQDITDLSSFRKVNEQVTHRKNAQNLYQCLIDKTAAREVL